MAATEAKKLASRALLRISPKGKGGYEAVTTYDPQISDISGNRVKAYETAAMMESAREAYLCEFSCTFEKPSEEKKKQTAKARKQLIGAAIFCFLFMLCEFGGGIWANSLALMSDAGHLLSDLASLSLSIFTLWLTTKQSSDRHSFGYHRAEILGAMCSVFFIWALTIWLVYEAIWRFISPEDVDGQLMFIVAGCGIVVNIIMGFILHQSGHEHSHGGLSGGHGHSHGGDDHGHSHGGDHGHSHGGDHKKPHKHDDSHQKDTVVELEEKHDHCQDHAKEHEHEHAPEHAPEHKHKHGDECHHQHGKGDPVPSIIVLSDSDEDTDGKDAGNTSHAKESASNINVRSAFIHVVGDLVQSIGVMIAAALIWYDPQMFRLADPVCTLIFSVIVAFTTRYLIRDVFDVLMESVPRHIDVNLIRQQLKSLSDVAEVHDLHVWMLSMGKPALSVHLIVNAERVNPENEAAPPVCLDAILRSAQKICRHQFGIDHATIQIEWPKCDHQKTPTKPKKAKETKSDKDIRHLGIENLSLSVDNNASQQ